MKREGGHFNNRSDTALYRYNYSFLGGAYSYTWQKFVIVVDFAFGSMPLTTVSSG